MVQIERKVDFWGVNAVFETKLNELGVFFETNWALFFETNYNELQLIIFTN